MTTKKCPLCNKKNPPKSKRCTYCDTPLNAKIKDDSLSVFKKINNIFNKKNSKKINDINNFLKENEEEIKLIINKLNNIEKFINETDNDHLDKYYKLYEETLKIEKDSKKKTIALNADNKITVFTINRVFNELEEFIKSKTSEINKINLTIYNFKNYKTEYDLVLKFLENYKEFIKNKSTDLNKFITKYNELEEEQNNLIKWIENNKTDLTNFINIEETLPDYINENYKRKIKKENEETYNKCLEIEKINIKTNEKIIKDYINTYENLEKIFKINNYNQWIKNNKPQLNYLINIENNLPDFIDDVYKRKIKNENKYIYNKCLEIQKLIQNKLIENYINKYNDLDKIINEINKKWFETNKTKLNNLINIENNLPEFIDEKTKRKIKKENEKTYNKCLEIQKLIQNEIIENYINKYNDLDNIFKKINYNHWIKNNETKLNDFINIEYNYTDFIDETIKRKIKEENKETYNKCLEIQKLIQNEIINNYINKYNDLENTFKRINFNHWIKNNETKLNDFINIENNLPEFIDKETKTKIKKENKETYNKCLEIEKINIIVKKIIKDYINTYDNLDNIFNKINYNYWIKTNESKLNNFNKIFDDIPVNYVSISLKNKIDNEFIPKLQKIKKFNDENTNSIIKINLINKALNNYVNFEKQIPIANEKYIKNELKINKEFFDNIDGKSLDELQRRAVVIDEDNVQINAGAGTGKTLTLQAKVKYLIEKKNIKPSEILLISYSNASASDLKSRVNNMALDIEIRTFHAVGKKILKEFKQPNHVIDFGLNKIIREYFKKEIFNDDEKVKEDVVNLFSFYFHIPTNKEEINSIGELYDNEENVNFYSMESKIEKKETFKKEWMKSFEELFIANYLFLHGVEYEYEKRYIIKNKSYKKHIKNFKKLLHTKDIPLEIEEVIIKPIAEFVDITPLIKLDYNPDFYLPDYDIYLEHFGVNRDCDAPWLDETESNKYKEGIKWKREIHKEYKTKLIETYSYYQSEHKLLKRLKEKLEKEGVIFKEPDYDEIYKKLIIDNKIKEYDSLIKLISTFINLFKGNGFKESEFKKFHEINSKTEDEFNKKRNEIFLNIAEKVYLSYEKFLKDNKAIDFDDMVNNAVEYIENNNLFDNYKYIIIDEYQDTSFTRYKLIKSLQENMKSKILVVGDDWQSIYQFTGCDVSLFTEFNKYFVKPEITDIVNTYRNSQEIINVSGNFIKQNKKQSQKSLISNKPPIDSKKRFYFYYYNNHNEINVFEKMINDINKIEKDPKILILGRNKKDLETLIKLDEEKLFRIKGNLEENKFLTLVYKLNPKIKITFRTVHGSKGLEEDHVVLINLTNHNNGFPNKMGYDPIISTFVLRDSNESIPYAEERRLFYVALTRTKKNNYLFVPNFYKSEFVQELEKDYKDYIKFIQSEAITEKNISKYPDEYIRIPTKLKCPICKTGTITLLINTTKNWKKIICSHKRCSFDGGFYNEKIENINEIELCPECPGVLKYRTKYKEFKGCSNYPTCEYTKENYEGILKRYNIHSTGFKCFKCNGEIEIRIDKENGKRFVKCKKCSDFKGRIKKDIDLKNIKQCPKCGGILIKRNGRFGEFCGCSNYPRCKHTINIRKPKFNKT